MIFVIIGMIVLVLVLGVVMVEQAIRDSKRPRDNESNDE